MSSEADLPVGALRLRQLTKHFTQYRRSGAWRHAVPGGLVRVPPPGPVVLDHLDLDVEPGSTLGIIGPNGAGKSTMLKLLAGILTPTSGTIEHGGRVGSMIELGIGFHPDLTGWENLQVAGMLLGLSQDEVLERVDTIVEFAELADAMATPVKHYSTGMAARLGFALATHIDAAILAIDEVLSVGDRMFQEKCLDRISQLNRQGCTVLFVSHELSLVDLVCTRAIRLDGGRIVDDGPAGEVIQGYLGRPVSHLAPGEPPARIASLALHDTVIDPRTALEIDLVVEVLRPTDPPPQLAVDLSLPSIAPGIRIAGSASDAPIDWSQPGTHHLRGTTTPLPLSGGMLCLTAALRSSVREDLSNAEADFAITGSRRVVKPMVVLEPAVEVAPIEAPTTLAAPTIALGHGDVAAVVRGASKRFRSGTHRTALASALPGRLGKPRLGDRVALDGVDLEIRTGQALGLIGPNGAGKSTLLKAIAGVHQLDAGSIETRGRVVAVLELGVGFHGDLTGRENLAVSAALHGMSQHEVQERLPDILDLAGIGDAIDQPVKRYSTGMRARLGLALATHTPAEIVLIDELLAVGDEEFRTAAKRRIRELVTAGAAVVFVSHNLQLVQEVCDRVVRLETGALVDDGESTAVLARYGGTGWSAGPAIGTGPIRLHDLVLDERPHDPAVRFSCTVEITEPVPHVRLELTLREAGIDRSQFRTPEKIERVSGALEVLIEEGDLPGPGWYRVTGTTGAVHCDGRFDLTLAAVNARDGEAMAEVWKLAHFGDGRARPQVEFGVAWDRVPTSVLT